MVTNIPPGLQLTLIEHMAHLTSRDYAEVPRDLFLLGFVPKEQEKNIEDSGVVEVLADLYGKWTDGGGIKSVNANDVLVQMQDLAAEKGMSLSITVFWGLCATFECSEYLFLLFLCRELVPNPKLFRIHCKVVLCT